MFLSRKEPCFKAQYRRTVRGATVVYFRTSDVVLRARPPSLALHHPDGSEPDRSLDLTASEYSVPKACILRFTPAGEEHHEELTFESEAELRSVLKALLDHAGAVSSAKPLRLVCATWNLGNTLPSGADEQLTAWLQPDGRASDLYVVTCQECRLGGSSAWFDLVEKAVSVEEPVCRVGSASLGQQHLLVLCSLALRPHVTHVEAGSEAMGFAGVGANKGVAALAMRVYAAPLCFVGAHLAAHDHHCKQRNANVSEMERKLRLGSGAHPAAPSAAAASLDLSQRFEHVLLCGDLNYRVELARDEALSLVRRRAWAELLCADQLRSAMANNETCAGFREGAIDFAPTFKHVPGAPPLTEEQAADETAGGGAAVGAGLRAYEATKMRVPSWCDRVLWRSWPAAVPLQLLRYGSSPHLAASDHSPVSAGFVLTPRTSPPAPPPCAEGEVEAATLTLSELCLEIDDPERSSHHQSHDHGPLTGRAAPPPATPPTTLMSVEVWSDVCKHAAAASSLQPRQPRSAVAEVWRWGGEQLTVRLPSIVDGARLRASQLFAVVTSDDSYSRRHAGVVVGCGVLGCADALIGGSGGEFALALYQHGRQVGVLRGRLRAEPPPRDDSQGLCGLGGVARRLLACCVPSEKAGAQALL